MAITTESLYANQFQHYLTRNVTYVLGLVQQAGPVLTEELRVQALHTLSYALQAPTAWALTRDLFITLAPKMEQAGQREQWIPYLQEALHQSIARGDGAAAGECHFQLALLYRLLSQFDTAPKHLQAAFAHFTALGAQRDQARVLNERAWLEQLQRRYADARQHVEEALTLLDVDDPERAMSYRTQGAIAVGLHHWQQAEQFHQMALKIFEKHQDQRKVAWSLQNLAYAFHHQTKYNEAFILYRQAANKLWQLGDVHHFAMVMHNLGYSYSACQQWSDAIECYKQAERIFGTLNDRLRSARLYTDLGLAYLNLQDYISAEQSFTQSAKRFSALGDESWRLNAIDGLAMTYLAQKKYTHARIVLEEALHALDQTGEIMNYAYLHQSLNHHWLETIEAQEAIPGNVDMSSCSS